MKMKYLFLTLILVFASNILWSENITVSDKENRISLTVPSSSEIDYEDDGYSILAVYDENRTITIYVENKSDLEDSIDLNGFIKMYLKRWKTDSNFKLIEQSEFKLNNSSCQIVTYSDISDGRKYKNIAFFTESKDSFYFIDCGTVTSDFNKASSIFRMIASSIQIHK